MPSNLKLEKEIRTFSVILREAQKFLSPEHILDWSALICQCIVIVWGKDGIQFFFNANIKNDFHSNFLKVTLKNYVIVHTSSLLECVHDHLFQYPFLEGQGCLCKVYVQHRLGGNRLLVLQFYHP